MVIDCHVHVAATEPHGRMSARLQASLPFQFMQWRLGLRGTEAEKERALAEHLAQLIAAAPRLTAAVVLAFDAVYNELGMLNVRETHLHVTNDYVMDLVRQDRQMLFGCSVHPYRTDAIAQLERCVAGGAVLCKWLPNTQGMNPSDRRCFAFYEALAHYKLPLLSHTGGETSLPTIDRSVADPMLLKPALERGVTVIAAHCGTRSKPFEPDYVPQFVRLARDYERFYGDTSALNLPTRWYAYGSVLSDERVRRKLIHGSDWPIIPVPPPGRVGVGAALELMTETNWLARDVRIKQMLGFDAEYWNRAATILRLP
ncbi:MAG TPA: amidohydrolase family protein [Tepidisphaeraceae bacterium]|nr:amidohydrolase family protein [Tepidisphaeraceae bacterium]